MTGTVAKDDGVVFDRLEHEAVDHGLAGLKNLSADRNALDGAAGGGRDHEAADFFLQDSGGIV
jgi:hypothetical protein